MTTPDGPDFERAGPPPAAGQPTARRGRSGPWREDLPQVGQRLSQERLRELLDEVGDRVEGIVADTRERMDALQAEPELSDVQRTSLASVATVLAALS